MNLKKMSTEYLVDIIRELQSKAKEGTAECDFLAACKKELKRRWGIKG